MTPRVALPGRPEAERRVNAGLDTLSAPQACPGTGGARPARVAVTHAADDVLSVSADAGPPCGGAGRPCAAEAQVPFGSLRAFAAEGGPLARVADAQAG